MSGVGAWRRSAFVFHLLLFLRDERGTISKNFYLLYLSLRGSEGADNK